MKVVAVLMLALAVAMSACARTPRNAEQEAKAAAINARPWEPARAALDSALAKVKSSGIRAIEPLVPELEKSLADAPDAIAKGQAAPAKVLLADGLPEVMAAAVAAGVPLGQPPASPAPPQSPLPPPGGPAVTVLESPYPLISMMLGSYYLETRRPADAVRVLEAGLALPPAVADVPRSMVPVLSSERATALGQAGRWQDALVSWDRALKLPALSNRDRARMLRGRGVALIEMKRLNEAELSIRSSLAVEPGNALAENELAYIAAVRSGRAAVKPDARMSSQP